MKLIRGTSTAAIILFFGVLLPAHAQREAVERRYELPCVRCGAPRHRAGRVAETDQREGEQLEAGAARREVTEADVGWRHEAVWLRGVPGGAGRSLRAWP